MENLTITNGEFTCSTNISKLDLKVIHDFLANQSYWSKNIPFEMVKSSVDHSLNFGLYHKDKQIGYARVISDFTTIAYLGDVFILPEFRGKGLSKWIMKVIMNHPNLLGLRRWILLTADAHELYKKFGWTELKNPEKWMEMHNPEVYKVQVGIRE